MHIFPGFGFCFIAIAALDAVVTVEAAFLKLLFAVSGGISELEALADIAEVADEYADT